MTSPAHGSGMTFAPCLVWQPQDSEDGGERHCSSPSMNGNRSWRGSASYVERGRRLVGRLERRGVSPFETSRRIGQALALCAGQDAIRAGQIVNAELRAVVVTEIEFGGVPMQVRLGNMEVAAKHAALEDAEIVFDGVRVPEVGADIFLGAVVDRAVTRKTCADAGIDRATIGHQVGGLINVHGDDRAEGFCGHVWNVETAHGTVALDQRNDGSLVGSALTAGGALPSVLVGFLAANVGFVDFDHLARAAERASDFQVSHCLADAMPEEPRGFHAALKGPLKLAGRNAFLGRAEQIDGLQPYPHRNMARFEHSADLDGKGLAACVALAEANPVGLPLQASNVFLGCATVRTYRAIGPKPRLDEFVGSFFAMEMSGGKGELHGLSP